MSTILNLPLTVEEFDEIHDAKGINIADAWGTRGDEVAAEIVRRVNAHADLVEALRQIGTYPKARADEMSAPDMRLLARNTLAKLGFDVYCNAEAR